MHIDAHHILLVYRKVVLCGILFGRFGNSLTKAIAWCCIYHRLICVGDNFCGFKTSSMKTFNTSFYCNQFSLEDQQQTSIHLPRSYFFCCTLLKVHRFLLIFSKWQKAGVVFVVCCILYFCISGRKTHWWRLRAETCLFLVLFFPPTITRLLLL